MTEERLEFVDELMTKVLILMLDVEKPRTESERNLIRKIRGYAITILCNCNKLLQ